MTRDREVKICWTILGLSFIFTLVLVGYLLATRGVDLAFRSLALAFALSLVPGYAIVLSLHMWLHKIRPEFLHVFGGCSI